MGFLTEASVNLADDPELCALMVEAGFKKVFVGIETPSVEALEECHKLQNRNRDLVARCKRCNNAGLEVMGGFIVGFDSDKSDIFKRQFEFIQRSGVVTAMVGLLTALPQTRLWQRLKTRGTAGSRKHRQQHRRRAEFQTETEPRIPPIRLPRTDEEALRAAALLPAHPDVPQEAIARPVRACACRGRISWPS